jgi:ketosteroid isomerase-like protein
MDSEPMAVVTKLLRAIEESDEAALTELWADDVVQHEYPNRLFPNGATRDKAAILDGFRRGAKILRSQTYEVHHAVVSGNEVAYETTWSAVLDVPLGTKKPGDTMVARFAVFARIENGRIAAHRTYDCFEPF